MKIRMSKAVALALALASLGIAHEHPAPITKTSTGLAEIKKLAGTWVGTTQMEGKTQPVKTVFRVTAGGSAVEELLMAAEPQEMIDLYSDESGKVVMTHYCAMGNHPRMLQKDAKAGLVSLEMGPTADINAGTDTHMHALVLEMPSPDKLIERWTSYENGKPQPPTVFEFTKVKYR